MTLKLADLKAKLAIDKTALDDEVVRQAQLFSDAGDAHVMAVAERDKLKADLESVDAELADKGRQALSRQHERVTDAMVKTYVNTDKLHDKATEAYLKAKLEADRLQVLKESFHQRSHMLRDLCSLYVANYFEEATVRPNKAMDATNYGVRRERMAQERARRNRSDDT